MKDQNIRSILLSIQSQKWSDWFIPKLDYWFLKGQIDTF